MSPRRAPSPPPQIKGFDYVSLIGSGGFSDVFLYQQQRPRRRVAVKVLLNEWSSKSQRAAFDAEADLMATLSTHPSIVTIYEADVASDGRPYLAMEYCPRPNLGARYRTERLTVAESLRIAVQIAGAVETAHRAGILHRDIKPSNILVTEYGHPALTDFGISSTMDDAVRAEGMSIPWSPPESFAEPPVSSIATDVWALAATVYTLLAGRSPFEVPGGSNSSVHLIERIESSPLLPTGRSDVPATLERVLATAMAKNPNSRYPTVLAFARALQEVQSELSLDTTPIDLLDDSGHVQEEEPEEGIGTRLRQVVSIDPSGGSRNTGSRGTGSRSGSGRPTAERTPAVSARRGQRTPVPVSPSMVSATAPPAEGFPQYEPPTYPVATPRQVSKERYQRGSWSDQHHGETLSAQVEDTASKRAAAEQDARRYLLPAAVALVVLLGFAIAGFIWLDNRNGGSPSSDSTTTGFNPNPGGAIGNLVPTVSDLKGAYDATTNMATFSWSVDESQSQTGDRYSYRVLGGLDDATPKEIAIPQVELDAGSAHQVCIEVSLVRANGRASAEPARACAPDNGNTGESQ